MPDPHRIENELKSLLSGPHYASLLYHRNEFRHPQTDEYTPAVIAKNTAESICKFNLLLNPVEVVELKGYVELYRAHDGGSRLKSAGTLGQSWFERQVAETIWKATDKYRGSERERWFMEFLRTSNFVLPEWNKMLSLACMAVPTGSRVVVVRGRGNWKAMQTPSGKPRSDGAPGIGTPEEVMLHLRMMPIPGTLQCVVPLYNDNWVKPVNAGTLRWPFLS